MTHSCEKFNLALGLGGIWKRFDGYEIANDEQGYNETISHCPFCGEKL